MFDRVVARQQIDAAVPFHSVAGAVDHCDVMRERKAAEVVQSLRGAAREGATP
jgi:hypothetical protein